MRRNIKLFSYRETTSFKGLGVDFLQEERRMTVDIENDLAQVSHRTIKNFHREATKSATANHFSSLILRKDLSNVGR